MLTPKGSLLHLCALLLLLGGLLGGGVAMFLLGGGILVVLLYGRLRLRAGTVDVRRERPTSELNEDDSLHVRLEFANRSRGRVHVEYEDGLPSSARVTEGKWRDDIVLPARGTVRGDYRARFPLRGDHLIGPLRARFFDPFRNFVVESHERHSDEIVVYPRFLLADEFPTPSKYPSWMAGQHVVNSPGHGSDFFSLRDYQPSDRIRDINWKATARRDVGQALVVNQRTRDSYAEVVLALDAREPMGYGWETFSPLAQGARATVTIMKWVHRRRDAFRLLVAADPLIEIRPGNPDRQTMEALTLLARLQPGAGGRLRDRLEFALSRAQPRCPIVVVSSLESDDDCVEFLSDLKARGHHVAVVNPVPTFEAALDAPGPASASPDADDAAQALRGRGIPVIVWRPGQAFGEAVQEAGA